jgi:hypothetical protein
MLTMSDLTPGSVLPWFAAALIVLLAAIVALIVEDGIRAHRRRQAQEAHAELVARQRPALFVTADGGDVVGVAPRDGGPAADRETAFLPRFLPEPPPAPDLPADGEVVPPAPVADAWVDTHQQPIVLTVGDFTRVRPTGRHRQELLVDDTMAFTAGGETGEWRHLNPEWRDATQPPVVRQLDIQIDTEGALALFGGHGHMPRSHRAGAR